MADNPVSSPQPQPSAVSPVSSTSLSGMRAALASLDAAAHNIANLATPGFRRQQVLSSTQAAGGVTTGSIQAATPGHRIEADMVGQLAARHAFLANLAVFKTGDQMLGSLLDTHR